MSTREGKLIGCKASYSLSSSLAIAFVALLDRFRLHTRAKTAGGQVGGWAGDGEQVSKLLTITT